jgi:hypothetical protein
MLQNFLREIGSTQGTQKWSGRSREWISGEISNTVRGVTYVTRRREVSAALLEQSLASRAVDAKHVEMAHFDLE